VGTAAYAAMRALKRKPGIPRDDIEGAYWVMLDLLLGGVSWRIEEWRNQTGSDDDGKHKFFLTAKQKTFKQIESLWMNMADDEGISFEHILRDVRHLPDLKNGNFFTGLEGHGPSLAEKDMGRIALANVSPFPLGWALLLREIGDGESEQPWIFKPWSEFMPNESRDYEIRLDRPTPGHYTYIPVRYEEMRHLLRMTMHQYDTMEYRQKYGPIGECILAPSKIEAHNAARNKDNTGVTSKILKQHSFALERHKLRKHESDSSSSSEIMIPHLRSAIVGEIYGSFINADDCDDIELKGHDDELIRLVHDPEEMTRLQELEAKGAGDGIELRQGWRDKEDEISQIRSDQKKSNRGPGRRGSESSRERNAAPQDTTRSNPPKQDSRRESRGRSSFLAELYKEYEKGGNTNKPIDPSWRSFNQGETNTNSRSRMHKVSKEKQQRSKEKGRDGRSYHD